MPTDDPFVTVVVPAHNEEAVIERCLDRLAAAAAHHRCDVIVVVNGSTDATADRVRAWRAPDGSQVGLVELSQPSKTAAIRAGLAAARADRPVVICDADIELDAASLRAMAEAMSVQAAVVASMPVSVLTQHCPALVRRWATVWTALPYVRSGVVGSGLTAVSAAGARRLTALPDVINDDGWIRRQFPDTARVSVSAGFAIRAPRTTTALVRRRARVLLGNAELTTLLGPDPERTAPAGLRTLLREGTVTTVDVAAYLAVAIAAKALAWYRISRGRRRLWAADQTTRPEMIAA